MGTERDVHSGDGRSNKDSAKGRGDVVGHGPGVGYGEADGKRGGLPHQSCSR